MIAVSKLDPMDEIADRAEMFASQCRSVSKRGQADSNLLPHGMNSLVVSLLDEGFSLAEIRAALNDTLKNTYLAASGDAGVSR